MKLRKNLLKQSRLYLILDKSTLKKRSLENIYSIVSNRNIDIVQLRDKRSAKKDILNFATKLSKRLRDGRTLFIVNDYVDLAQACKADGVHLGQSDLSLKQARKILGKHKIIGISCHNLSQAQKAQKEGADYIGIGPVFKTATKPGYKTIGLKVLKELKEKIKIPYFAIGGINQGNIDKIISCAGRRVAVCGEILEAKNPKQASAKLLNKLK